VPGYEGTVSGYAHHTVSGYEGTVSGYEHHTVSGYEGTTLCQGMRGHAKRTGHEARQSMEIHGSGCSVDQQAMASLRCQSKHWQASEGGIMCNACAQTHTHANTHTCTHTYTHKRMRTRTLALRQPQPCHAFKHECHTLTLVGSQPPHEHGVHHDSACTAPQNYLLCHDSACTAPQNYVLWHDSACTAPQNYLLWHEGR